jgi:hypothetical protein
VWHKAAAARACMSWKWERVEVYSGSNVWSRMFGLDRRLPCCCWLQYSGIEPRTCTGGQLQGDMSACRLQVMSKQHKQHASMTGLGRTTADLHDRGQGRGDMPSVQTSGHDLLCLHVISDAPLQWDGQCQACLCACPVARNQQASKRSILQSC